MKAKEAIEKLLGYDPEEEVCMILWNRDDVMTRLDDQEIDYDDVPPEMMRSILSIIERKHDAGIGITWDTIDYAIECHLLRDKTQHNQE